jgi:hypothetical protein
MSRATTSMLNGQEIDVDQALKLRDQVRRSSGASCDFRCVECGEPIRPHKEGDHAGAHFEHLTRNPNCQLSDHAR